MPQLELAGIYVSYGDVEALKGVDLRIEPGEFFTIVGPTNAGKSSLLKTIGGLIRPVSGTVWLMDKDVTGLSPRDRNVSLLFQNIALFPTLTGFENIAFPLRVSGLSDEAIDRRVIELGKLLRVDHVLQRLPRTFSGGEQQRVAIGRAIAGQSDLLMLDEPLTNLDARIRIALRVEFKSIHRALGQTVLYVTHDPVEAMSLSDRIAVLNDGRFEQVGTPDEIYHRPATRFVAEFFGMPPMNIVRGRVADDAGTLHYQVGDGSIPLSEDIGVNGFNGRADELVVGVRPENVRVSVERTVETPLALQVLWVERYGSHSVLDLRLGDTVLRARIAPNHPAAAAEQVWIGFEIRRQNLLDSRTNRFLA